MLFLKLQYSVWSCSETNTGLTLHLPKRGAPAQMPVLSLRHTCMQRCLHILLQKKLLDPLLGQLYS